ncbi:MAG: hypothetical protein WCP46_00340 [Alphaproteobacteria bacterium]
MELDYGPILQKGDLIAIAYSNRFTFAYFLGRGQGDSLQYHAINRVIHHINYKIEHPESRYKLYKEYINSVRSNRVLKYDINFISDLKTKEEFIKVYEFLLHEGYLK